jgi:hypothetical protein
MASATHWVALAWQSELCRIRANATDQLFSLDALPELIDSQYKFDSASGGFVQN